MDLHTMPLFKALGERADYLNRQQKIISANIANADTPGYKAQTLEPFSFEELETAPSAGVQRTDAQHLAGTEPAGHVFQETAAEARETAPDGNSVVLEQQMKQAANVRVQHRLALDAYKKHVDMLTKVVRGSGK
jgi:flagellar basal-body rod protein FlgB